MADPASHDPQSLFDPLEVPAALALLYTSPAGADKRGTRVAGIHVCNRAGSAQTFSLTHTESGGAASVTKALVWEKSLTPGEEFVFAQGIIMDPGDFLSHDAGAVNELVIHGYGWEMTD